LSVVQPSGGTKAVATAALPCLTRQVEKEIVELPGELHGEPFPSGTPNLTGTCRVLEKKEGEKGGPAALLIVFGVLGRGSPGPGLCISYKELAKERKQTIGKMGAFSRLNPGPFSRNKKSKGLNQRC